MHQNPIPKNGLSFFSDRDKMQQLNSEDATNSLAV
jgi:hypothetical protein